uniref:Uncharacterized protein n=1 Tax=Nothobranchius furzeri TaxID=105023 RepID=A0A1A8UKC9_NOTFU
MWNEPRVVWPTAQLGLWDWMRSGVTKSWDVLTTCDVMRSLREKMTLWLLHGQVWCSCSYLEIISALTQKSFGEMWQIIVISFVKKNGISSYFSEIDRKT